MNQTCKVCGEPAAGFHFGAFTCEGCKSFFGRSYNNLSSISECKNNGKCIIDKKNRTTCKACRLRKCYTVGMSKGGSRYGRRSNWFKIHCLLQEQQQQAVEAAGKAGVPIGSPNAATHGFGADMAAAAAAAAAAQQHLQQQQRNPHMAQHMGGLLGYPSYLPEMAAAASPFGRHPADAAAAAALPFFSMMNTLPNMGSPQSAFQLPPHLLFSGYHPGAAAAAAADAAYRSEMYKHRQSVDSAASGDSQRFTPPSSVRTQNTHVEEERLPSPVDVCVADDDEDHHSVNSHQSHYSSNNSTSPASHHTIHNPIAIRATSTHHHHHHHHQHQQQQQQQHSNKHSPVHYVASHTPEPIVCVTATIAVTSNTTTSPTSVASSESLSFAAKMQSLSPVSVCSISQETNVTTTAAAATGASAPVSSAADQDCPMDLSMKTSISSTHSSATESDAHSDSSSSEEHELRQDARRKFYQLNSSETDTETEAVKRQKLAIDEATAAAVNASSFGTHGGFALAHNVNTMRGTFVCV